MKTLYIYKSIDTYGYRDTDKGIYTLIVYLLYPYLCIYVYIYIYIYIVNRYIL